MQLELPGPTVAAEEAERLTMQALPAAQEATAAMALNGMLRMALGEAEEAAVVALQEAERVGLACLEVYMVEGAAVGATEAQPQAMAQLGFKAFSWSHMTR